MRRRDRERERRDGSVINGGHVLTSWPSDVHLFAWCLCVFLFLFFYFFFFLLFFTYFSLSQHRVRREGRLKNVGVRAKGKKREDQREREIFFFFKLIFLCNEKKEKKKSFEDFFMGGDHGDGLLETDKIWERINVAIFLARSGDISLCSCCAFIGVDGRKSRFKQCCLR